MNRFVPTLLTILLALGACSSDDPPPDGGGGGGDGGVDGGGDAGGDAATPDLLADLTDRDGGPGVFEVTPLVTTPAFKSRVAVGVGPDGNPRVAYNVATHPERDKQHALRFTSRSGSNWDDREAVAAEGISNEFPVLLVDRQGRTHIVYNRYIPEQNQIELYHVWSDDQQSFSTPANITNTTNADEFAAAAAIDDSGALHILTPQHQGDLHQVLYIKLADGTPSAPEDVGTELGPLAPLISPDHAIAVSPDGQTVYAAYPRQGQSAFESVIWLRRRSDAWQPEQRLTEATSDSWSPAMGVDASGTLHTVYVTGFGDVKTLTYRQMVGGALQAAKAITSSVDDRSYYLGLVVEPVGRLHVGFLRFTTEGENKSNADVFYVTGRDGVFDPEVQITDTAELDEGTPSIAVTSGGEVFIGFTENLSTFPDGVVYLASGSEGGGEVDGGAPDLGADGASPDLGADGASPDLGADGATPDLGLDAAGD